MNWEYNGEDFIGPIDDYYGFIYFIVNWETGKKYVGRKFFTKSSTKQKNGKKKKIRKESDWQEYYGSSPELLADVEKYGKDKFHRQILRLCKTRGECNYYEAKEIFTRDALLDPSYYNNWVSTRVHASHLKHLTSPQ